MALTFLVCEVLTHQPLGVLDPKAFSFNNPVWGGGAAEMTVTIPRINTTLKRLTRPDETELFILDDDQFVWNGIIQYRLPNTKKQELKLKCQSWDAWLYTRLFPEKRIRLATDKYTVAYEIIDFAQNDFGCPDIARGTALSGDVNDATIEPWWSAGKALDNFGQREGGYEWGIGARYGVGGAFPELFFSLWEPGQERGQRPVLYLNAAESTNYVNVGEIPEDASERRSRVWATGEGQPGDQPVLPDEDPALTLGRMLLRETVTNWSGVVNAATLFDHAHSERLARANPYSQVKVDHALGHPNIKSYTAGDRARLVVNDGWNNFDIRGIRIIDRAVTKSENAEIVCTVTLDFADIKDIVV